MPKAYSYIRFSTPEQARGDSLRRQLEKAEQWCAKHGLVLDESLRDEGVSAYRGTNAEVGGALGSFLELLKSGKVEHGSLLLVENLDRLSRQNVMIALPRFLDLINAGVTIVTLADEQEYSAAKIERDFSPLIVSLCAMARAHEESKIKAERVSAAWARKRIAARDERRPMGQRCPSWLRLVDGHFDLVPHHVETVRRIFRMAIEGYGQRAIVIDLNRNATPTFRGGDGGWQTSTVRRVLTSRTVLGEYEPHTGTHRGGTWRAEGEPIKGYYPAVVAEEDYWRAQRALEGRRSGDGVRGRGGRRGPGVTNLLLGLGRCVRCGGAMHILNKGPLPKGGIYFTCSTALRRTGCENTTHWRADRIERRLLRGLAYLDAQAILSGHRPGGEDDRVGILRAQLADAERRRARLLVLVESGDDAATARFASIAGEVRSLRRDLSAAESDAAKASADPGLQARLADAVGLSEAMNEADGDERAALRVRLAEQLRSLVKEIRYDPELGVLAVLTPQPGVAPEDVPWIVGQRSADRWRLWLNGDTDPHGTDVLDDGDADESPGPSAIFGARRQAEG